MRNRNIRKSHVLTVARAEQDNRMFTNAEETATQNNNKLHTGFYAGEREDFMMNGIYYERK